LKAINIIIPIVIIYIQGSSLAVYPVLHF